MTIPVPALIARFEQDARERLDPNAYDYVAGGSGTEVSLTDSATAWRRHRLLPHVLRDVSQVDPSVKVFGTRLPSPVGVAPVGFQQLLHAEGEAAVAAGAGGHLVVVSARADVALDQIAAARSGSPWWFQPYVTAERSIGDDLVDRAAAAGTSALVLTGDTPYVAVKARQGRLRDLSPGADQAPATLADIDRLARRSGLPVLVKGVLRANDARAVLDAGASGLVVSNHGGRQLDGAAAPADVLADVVAAAGGAPVLVDGGLRSGHDVLIALALGATAVLAGRPVAWALAAGGARGVRTLLDAWTAETAHVMGLAGCRSVDEVTSDLVLPAVHPAATPVR